LRLSLLVSASGGSPAKLAVKLRCVSKCRPGGTGEVLDDATHRSPCRSERSTNRMAYQFENIVEYLLGIELLAVEHFLCRVRSSKDLSTTPLPMQLPLEDRHQFLVGLGSDDSAEPCLHCRRTNHLAGELRAPVFPRGHDIRHRTRSPDKKSLPILRRKVAHHGFENFGVLSHKSTALPDHIHHPRRPAPSFSGRFVFRGRHAVEFGNKSGPQLLNGMSALVETHDPRGRIPETLQNIVQAPFHRVEGPQGRLGVELSHVIDAVGPGIEVFSRCQGLDALDFQTPF